MPSSHDLNLAKSLEKLYLSASNEKHSSIVKIKNLDDLTALLSKNKSDTQKHNTLNVSFLNKNLYGTLSNINDIKKSIAAIVSTNGYKILECKGLNFLHTENINLVQAYEYKYNLEKVLSWSLGDSKLFDFMIFLESTFLSNLGSELSQSSILFLTPCIEESTLKNTQCLDSTDKTDMSKILSMALNTWKDSLDKHLQHTPCFTLFTTLFTNLDTLKSFDLEAMVSKNIMSEIDTYKSKTSMQTNAENFICNWYKEEKLSDVMQYKGVSLGEGLEYELIGELLNELGAFRETK